LKTVAVAVGTALGSIAHKIGLDKMAASSVEQVDQDVATIANLSFSDAELQKIEAILA
jgi:hypothetical protein